MSIHYIDYYTAVRQYYESCVRDGLLASTHLTRLTPANLRDECLRIAGKDISPRDRGMFAAFFETTPDTSNFRRAIENIDTGKFKPVISFLKGDTTNPNNTVVELAAWLIDFPDRPFRVGEKNRLTTDHEARREYGPSGSPLHEASQPEPNVDKAAAPLDEASTTDSNRSVKKENRPSIFWKWAFLLVLLTAVAGFSYLSGRQEWTLGSRFSAEEGCMRWTGDHYEASACQQIYGDTPVIAIDWKRLKYFRRVSSTEGMSKRELKALWYIRRNGDIEYYTGGGNHPEDPTKYLHRMTDYMIRTHHPDAR